MIQLKYVLTFFILAMAWCACNDEMENPGYSEIPYITFENIEVFDGQCASSMRPRTAPTSTSSSTWRKAEFTARQSRASMASKAWR
jgi:hypothetical protein